MASRSLCMNPKSAECPICYRLLKRPKLLSCNHTFCEGCLSNLYRAQRRESIISCPLCRDITPVRDGDMSRLGTNIALQSLIEELGKVVHYCSLCRSKDDALAVSYCADCDVYMCDSCRKTHASWGGFSGHEEICVNDVIAGKAVKTTARCSKHRSEMEDYFCITCGIYVCFRCRVLSHSGHDLLEKEEHEQKRKERITTLLGQAEAEKLKLSQFSSLIKEDQQKVKERTQGMICDITALRNAAIKIIEENSETLVKMCKTHEQVLIENQTGIKNKIDTQYDCMESASELVNIGRRRRLEGNALIAHDTICQHLQQTLDGYAIDYSRKRKILEYANNYKFCTTAVEDIPGVGSLLQRMDWGLGAETYLPVRNSMNGMAARPDGMMAIGCLSGGIDIFSPAGKYHQTVLKDINIRRLDFLSDGTYVVRDLNEHISLYTPEFQKLDTTFDTLSHAEGGVGGISVDGHDQIYASYRDANIIQVFSKTGGRPIRKIPCKESVTQIFAMKSSSNLVLHLHGCNEVWIVDKSGKIKHTVPAKGSYIYPYPAVCRNDYVMISWIKQQRGLVTIDLYTNELKYMKEHCFGCSDSRFAQRMVLPAGVRVWGYSILRYRQILCIP